MFKIIVALAFIFASCQVHDVRQSNKLEPLRKRPKVYGFSSYGDQWILECVNDSIAFVFRSDAEWNRIGDSLQYKIEHKIVSVNNFELEDDGIYFPDLEFSENTIKIIQYQFGHD